MMKTIWLILCMMMLPLWGCSMSSGPPTQADPLVDMEVSHARFALPPDEEQRLALPLGVFTGIKVGDSRLTLEDQLQAPVGVLVTEVVENSPAVAADIHTGDILLEASVGQQRPTVLSWPSDWYRIEQTATPDSTISILYDRAGRDGETTLKPVARISPTERLPGNRFREEAKVGIIVRNASEVEAHQAGLTRGEGTVVVGLAQTSPWRAAGVLFGDVVTEINGEHVKNPEELLAAIDDLEKGHEVSIVVYREGEKRILMTTVSQRKRKTADVSIPLLYSYENKRGIQKSSVLLGLYGERKTAVAAEYTVLWFIKWTVGDSNLLEETK
ncbi:PDZ domain-containing protein [Planctomycetota bacterium]